MQKIQSILTWIAVLVITFSLQSCITTASTAVSGASAVYNRKQIQKNLKDEYISMQAEHLINYDPQKRFKSSNLSVATFEGVVLLTGQTPDPELRQAAEKLVKTINGVNKIYNFITVSESASNLTEASDAWITAKIKSKYMASEDVDPTHIKVVTANGTVFLLGTVLASEADAAVAFARTTDGVQNVVKMFNYLEVVHREQGASSPQPAPA